MRQENLNSRKITICYARKMPKRERNKLDHERFTTSAFAFSVWIVENEAGSQFVVLPVHLGADHGEQCLRVNQHLNSILDNFLVEFSGLFNVFEMINKT